MPKRLFICVADIEQLYGTTKSRTWCERHYNHIKRHYNLQRHQTPTIEQYCQYDGLDIKTVLAFLRLTEKHDAADMVM